MPGMHIQLKEAGKTFDRLRVLRGINLEVKPGEFLAIVGKSGCGKSTLLRIIAGLEPLTEGALFIDGRAAEGLHEDVRIMFQDPRLLPWKTVLDNVSIGTGGKDKETARTALRLVGLEEKQQEWPSVLSGGQQQRVALARALASKPKLLLFDEPLGALDALTRLEMQNLIESLWKEEQFTAILVTHDVSEAVRLADRVIVIKNGNIDLNVEIPLNRPRQVDQAFIHYQNTILARLMNES